MVTHDPSVSTQSQKLAQELSSKMQTVSFKIGDEKKRDLKDASTTYKQTISQQSLYFKSAQARSHSHIGGKATNIKIGSEPTVNYTSEQKEKFIPQAQSSQPLDPNRAKELRKHHFTLEETNKVERPNYFETVKNIDYNYKGDPRTIRSFIPAEVKENQRSSHFKVGFENQSPFLHHQNNQPVMLMQGNQRPGSAYSRASSQGGDRFAV